MTPLDPAIAGFLAASGLADPATAQAVPLTGGVASDILRIDADGRSFAVKRALARLRVARDWRVPTGRNAHEVAWLQLAGAIVPTAVPRVLAHDPAAGLFAMTYLDPATHPVWKAELAAGRVDPGFAAAVGRTLATLHAATAHRPAVAERFANQDLFRAIRLDPYLAEAGRAHPDLAAALAERAAGVDGARIALMHGDVSPKNILRGRDGPVFLDAECACYGDPAFDAAFCLTHLLLKCLWVPTAKAMLLASFDALAAAWLDHMDWEDPAAAEARVARLLPALLLARVDGKSPVEYLAEGSPRDRVRAFARRFLLAPADQLAAVRAAW